MRELPGGAAGRGRLAEEEADLLHAPGQGRPPRHRRRLLGFASLFSDPALCQLYLPPLGNMGIGEMPRRMNGQTSCRRLVGSTPSDHENGVWALD